MLTVALQQGGERVADLQAAHPPEEVLPGCLIAGLACAGGQTINTIL